MRKYMQYVENQTMTDESVCKDTIRRVAYVKFQLTGKSQTID